MRLCIYIYFLFVTAIFHCEPRAFDKRSIKSVLTYLLIDWTSLVLLKSPQFVIFFINIFKDYLQPLRPRDALLILSYSFQQKLEKLQCPYKDTKQEGIENAICHFLAILQFLVAFLVVNFCLWFEK